MEAWRPLDRKQALAARDFSRAGETFVDHLGRQNEILCAILTPLSYHVYISAQKFRHIEKHPIASKRLANGKKGQASPWSFFRRSRRRRRPNHTHLRPAREKRNAAEIVQWVWEKYYAHLQKDVQMKTAM